jgi:hypothetical protein
MDIIIRAAHFLLHRQTADVPGAHEAATLHFIAFLVMCRSGNTKTATVGNYRSVQISDATATSLPVLTAETGVIVNGLPYGVKVSSDNPLPQPSTKSPAKILGRRLQQLPNPVQLRNPGQMPNPVVIGAGDEAGNYIGTSSGIITVEGKEGNAVWTPRHSN